MAIFFVPDDQKWRFFDLKIGLGGGRNHTIPYHTNFSRSLVDFARYLRKNPGEEDTKEEEASCRRCRECAVQVPCNVDRKKRIVRNPGCKNPSLCMCFFGSRAGYIKRSNQQSLCRIVSEQTKVKALHFWAKYSA